MTRVCDTAGLAAWCVWWVSVALTAACVPSSDGAAGDAGAPAEAAALPDGSGAADRTFGAMLKAADSREVRGAIRRCRNGDAEACYGLGDRYRRGDGVSEERRRALRLHARACLLGSVRACHDLGMRFFQGLGIERNLRAAQIFLERACAEGAGESCHVLGRMGEEKLGGIASDDRTRRLFWRACVVGYRRDCLREEVAVRSATGPHEERLGSRAPERIAEAARRCDGGLPAACWMLSRAYETGRGVPRDPVAAESLRRTACEWGVLSACYGAVSPVGAPVEAVPP